MDLLARIDRLLAETVSSVQSAAQRFDFAAVAALTERGEQLTRLRKQVQEIVDALNSLDPDRGDHSFEAPTPPFAFQAVHRSGTEGNPVAPVQAEIQGVENGPHRMVIEVTQGMLNQNLLTLTEHVQAGRVRAGMDFVIEARPSGNVFRTDLLADGNRLRERGAIAHFYRQAGVRAGDRVVLRMASPNRWMLEKLQHGPVLPHAGPMHGVDQI